MIGALLKQELIATWKGLATLIGAVFAVVVVASAMMALPVPVVSQVLLIFGVIATIVLIPAAQLFLAYCYWTSMYGRRGYFTMVIPVRGRTIFWIKVLYAELVTVAAGLLTVVSAAILLLGWGVGQRLTIAETFEAPYQVLFSDPEVSQAVLWFSLGAMVLQFVVVVIEAAALMSIGARSNFNHLGIGAPLIGGVILYFANQIIQLAAILLIPVGIVLYGPEAGQIVPRGMWSGFVEAVQTGAPTVDVLGLGFIPVAILIAGVLAWFGARSVDRHTSLR